MHGDAVDLEVIEAIYDDGEETRAAWLSRVLAHVRGDHAGGRGGVAYAYDMSGPARGGPAYPVVDAGPPTFAEDVYQSFRHAPPEFRRELFGKMGPAGTYSATMGSP